ncbi:MAG: RHS repeat-associated core domain-containing protein, partial [Polyangiaceae bacterium]
RSGNWVSPDPAGEVDGPNLYAYVRNNPVNLTDPLGTQTSRVNVILGAGPGVTGDSGFRPEAGAPFVRTGAEAIHDDSGPTGRRPLEPFTMNGLPTPQHEPAQQEAPQAQPRPRPTPEQIEAGATTLARQLREAGDAIARTGERAGGGAASDADHLRRLEENARVLAGADLPAEAGQAAADAAPEQPGQAADALDEVRPESPDPSPHEPRPRRATRGGSATPPSSQPTAPPSQEQRPSERSAPPGTQDSRPNQPTPPHDSQTPYSPYGNPYLDYFVGIVETGLGLAGVSPDNVDDAARGYVDAGGGIQGLYGAEASVLWGEWERLADPWGLSSEAIAGAVAEFEAADSLWEGFGRASLHRMEWQATHDPFMQAYGEGSWGWQSDPTSVARGALSALDVLNQRVNPFSRIPQGLGDTWDSITRGDAYGASRALNQTLYEAASLLALLTGSQSSRGPTMSANSARPNQPALSSLQTSTSRPRFSRQRLERIINNLTNDPNTDIRFWMDDAAEAYLDAHGSSGQYLPHEGGGIVVLRPNPARSTVIEELYHLGQHRRAGFSANWGPMVANAEFRAAAVVALEVEAQEHMMRLGHSFRSRIVWTQAELSHLAENQRRWLERFRNIRAAHQ